MTQNNRYPDCASCAFADEGDHPICDACEDGDQWEPADDVDGFFDEGAHYATTRIEKPVRTRQLMKKAA